MYDWPPGLPLSVIRGGIRVDHIRQAQMILWLGRVSEDLPMEPMLDLTMTDMSTPPVSAAIDRVVVISDDAVRSGGAAVMALTSIRLLRERGISVTLLTGDSGDNPELTAIGCRVEALGSRNLLEGNRLVSAARGLYSKSARSFVSDWIDRNDTPATVYHLHNWHKVLSPSVFAALRPVAPRLLMTLHDYFLVCPNGGYSHFARSEPCDLVPMSPRCMLTSCDKRHYGHKVWRLARSAVRSAVIDVARTPATLIAMHDAMLPHLARGGVDITRVRVLPNPVTPWTTTRVTAEYNREIYFVGRLEADKGIDLLARSCARIGAELSIIGNGPLAASLSEVPGVRLLGRLSPRQIAERIVKARIVVVPSRSRETFGLVALEAAMSGVPVVVSDLAPISKDLERLGAGALMKNGDEEGLAAILQRLLADDAAVAGMSRRAFNGTRSIAPSPEIWCSQLIEIYSKVLALATRQS